VALFIFLAGAAWARIVAAHLFLRADDLLHRLHISRASHPRLFKLATLATHESLFQIIGGSRDQAGRTMSVPPTALLR
jgi:hypothetical protein